MESPEGSAVFAAFRAGKALYKGRILRVVKIPPKGDKLLDIEYADGTVEWGVLPSLVFESLAAARKADPEYFKGFTELNVCDICRVAGASTPILQCTAQYRLACARRSADGREVLECAECALVIHDTCYAVFNDPDDDSDWICQRCADGATKKQAC